MTDDSVDQVTPEHLFLTRRRLLSAAALAALGIVGAAGLRRLRVGPTADEFGDPVTPLSKFTSYGNYYEFTRAKLGIAELASQFSPPPWQLRIDGLVRRPLSLRLEDIREFGLEERVYRLRCIECWSMVIPWLGVPLHKLLAEAGPLPEAKYVRFESFYDPDQLPGQRAGAYEPTPSPGELHMGAATTAPYVWPYVEGLRLDEAWNDLVLVAIGAYGKPLPPSAGAPLRIVVPWKYGFKSPKLVVRAELVTEQPTSFWMAAMPEEHGFYANVNPDVPHPRWSQAREVRYLGRDPEPIVATLKFNGYAEKVAALYEGMDLSVHF